MKVKIGSVEQELDRPLIEILEMYKARIRKNWDAFVAISGEEGDGKSTFAKQLCCYMTNGKFDVSHIAWTPEQFEEKVLAAKPESAVLYDEAISGLDSLSTMSTVNRKLRKMAAQCRKRRLFICILLPSFFDLDKNMAIHRTRGLFKIYAPKLKRGYYAYYNKDKKKKLYILGKKYYDEQAVPPFFTGRFTGWTMIDEEEYEKQKDEALIKQIEENEEKTSKQMLQRNVMFKALHDLGWTQTKIANYLTEHGVKTDQKTISNGLAALNVSQRLVMP